MANVFSKQYWLELRDFAYNSSPKFKVFCLIFIFTTNVAGTTPFLRATFYNYFIFEIWKASLLADIFYIFSMSSIFYITIRFATNSKSKLGYYISPLLTTALIPIGFVISWFLVCIGGEFEYGSITGLPFVDGNLASFIIPISPEMELENMAYVWLGFNGLWIPAIIIAIMIFTSVPKPEPAS